MIRAKALSALLAAAGIALPAAGEELRASLQREITGALRYDAKMALPPEARVHVEARGAFGTLLGETTFTTEGRQVPIPFAVEVPAKLSGDLRAVVRLKGRPRWIVEDVPFPGGAADAEVGEIALKPVTPLAFATHFDCGGTPVAFGVLDDRAVMRVRDRDIPMKKAAADTGDRYVAADDSKAELIRKEGEVTVALGGEALPACTETEPDRTVPYRAQGRDPDWSVVIREAEIDITAPYADLSRRVPRPEVEVTAGAYHFDMPGIGTRLTLHDEICHGAESGLPHPHQAGLDIGERILPGCGGDPASLLTGGVWHVRQAMEEPAVGDSDPTIAFDPDGRAGGRTGCNVYGGSYEINAEGVHFGQMVSTMMACPDPLMQQERRILDAIEKARRFDIDATGALVLTGGGDVLLRARRE